MRTGDGFAMFAPVRKNKLTPALQSAPIFSAPGSFEGVVDRGV
jgi:hypothetical protein